MINRHYGEAGARLKKTNRDLPDDVEQRELGKLGWQCIIRARNVAAVAQLVEQLIRNQ